MCVCIFIYANIISCVYTYMYIYICISTHMFAYLHMFMHMYLYLYMYIYMYTYMHMDMYMCMYLVCICLCVCVYIFNRLNISWYVPHMGAVEPGCPHARLGLLYCYKHGVSLQNILKASGFRHAASARRDGIHRYCMGPKKTVELVLRGLL